MVEGGLNTPSPMDGHTSGYRLIGETSSFIGSKSDKKKRELKCPWINDDVEVFGCQRRTTLQRGNKK